MPCSQVYLTDLSGSWTETYSDKISDLFQQLEPASLFTARDMVAVKLHFGEAGNTSYVRPQYVRPLVRQLNKLGTKPFLTDTSTLYVGSRSNAPSHLLTAFDHGFTREIVGAPILIADGLRGKNGVAVPFDGQHTTEAHIAADIHNADGLLVVSHFKGHELTGFGGALKNLGMGCAARQGKLFQHSNVSPEVTAEKCVGCGQCLARCQVGAIDLLLQDGEPKAVIDNERCVGCAECIISCPEQAVEIQWNETIQFLMEKMMEYAACVAFPKQGKVAYVTFVTDVTPYCDCLPFSHVPIVPNLGILASHDPVAIDQAAMDLVINAQGNEFSKLESAFSPGEDKFRALYPQVDWTHQLDYAEHLQIGTRTYDLVEIGHTQEG